MDEFCCRSPYVERWVDSGNPVPKPQVPTLLLPTPTPRCPTGLHDIASSPGRYATEGERAASPEATAFLLKPPVLLVSTLNPALAQARQDPCAPTCLDLPGSQEEPYANSSGFVGPDRHRALGGAGDSVTPSSAKCLLCLAASSGGQSIETSPSANSSSIC